MAAQVKQLTGNNPVDLEVLNDHDAVIEMEPESVVVHAAQALHATHIWEGRITEISCLMSSCKSVINIVHERETARMRL